MEGKGSGQVSGGRRVAGASAELADKDVAGLPLSVSSPTAANPLRSSTLRETGLPSAALARILVSPYLAAARSRTCRTAAVAEVLALAIGGGSRRARHLACAPIRDHELA